MVLKTLSLLFISFLWFLGAHAQNPSREHSKKSDARSVSAKKINSVQGQRGPASRPHAPKKRQASRKVSPKRSASFEQAQKLFDDGKYLQAFEFLDSKYTLNSKGVPTAVLNLAIDSLLKGGKVGHAENLSRSVLIQKVPWWNNYKNAKDRESLDLSTPLEKASPHMLRFLWLTGESQSILYQDFYKQLSKEERDRLKRDSRAIYDALLQSSYDSDQTEQIFSRIQAAEALEARRPYKFGRHLNAKFISWSDHFDYTFQNGQHSQGEALARALCLGGGLSYESLIWQFELSGCFGLGKSAMSLNTGFYSDISARAIQLSAGAYRRLDNLRIDVGLEGFILSRYFDLGPIATEAEPVSFSDNISFGLAPGIRMHFKSFFVGINVGKIFGQSSAIWTLEASYKL